MTNKHCLIHSFILVNHVFCYKPDAHLEARAAGEKTISENLYFPHNCESIVQYQWPWQIWIITVSIKDTQKTLAGTEHGDSWKEAC